MITSLLKTLPYLVSLYNESFGATTLLSNIIYIYIYSVLVLDHSSFRQKLPIVYFEIFYHSDGTELQTINVIIF